MSRRTRVHRRIPYPFSRVFERARASRDLAGTVRKSRSRGFETLESRHLLSGSPGLEYVLGLEAHAEAAGWSAELDVSQRFAWSGWKTPQAALPSTSTSEAREAHVTELTYVFANPPELEPAEIGYRVAIDGETPWVSPGEPVLPSRTSRVLLPQGTSIESVEVDFGPGIVMATDVELMATPAMTPLGQHAEGRYETVSESFGGSVTFETQRLRGYSVGVLSVLPVAYEANTGTLTYHEDVRVRVTAVAADADGTLPVRDSLDDVARVLDLVENDSAIADYQAPASVVTVSSLPPGGPYEYLVIAPESLADAFGPLIDHKISRGLTAAVVTTEHIDANYASPYAGEDDLAGRVREFLADAYVHWNTQWVLLAGDADSGQEIGPYRYVRAVANGYDRTFLSDMYFACLDGPYNFTADADWGQVDDGPGGGDVDRAPDVFVGRAPASNVAEVTHFVNKTILYETTPPPNPTTGLWIGGKLNSDPLTWGADSSDAIIAGVVPDGYTHDTLYQRDGSYGRVDVIDRLNASPGFVHHLGHATATSNAYLAPEDPPQLTNAHPYVFYSQGCHSGAFRYDDSLAEAHTVGAQQAAVAAIFNTDYGWYIPGTLGGSHLWAREFFDAIFNEGLLHLGQAHFDSKNDLPSQWGTSRWIFYAATLFGDPETRIFLPQSGGPTAVGSTPATAQTEPVSSITVEFSEPMDRESFDLGDVVSFTGVDGSDLRGQLVGYQWRDFWTLEIRFLAQRTVGLYSLTIGPDVLDFDGHPMDQDHDGGGEPVDDRYSASFAIEESVPGEIHGTSWNDLDGDGQQDPDEPGLSGWTIYLDANLDGQPDLGEAWTVTDSTGAYSLTGLPPGTHTLAELVPAQWQQTFPDAQPGDLYSVDLAPGQIVENVDFGNRSTVPQVVDRHVFYNNSAFDDNDPDLNADDDGAIATDKSALRPGHQATFANYTSYGRGINGIMVDLASPAVTPALLDFEFHVGNHGDPSTWAAAPEPSGIDVREGAGTGGSDRVTIVWPDHAVRKQWLRVTVRKDRLGLSEDDVFYFGNAVGEAGESASDARVGSTDLLLARNNPRSFSSPAPIDFPYDYDRDARVNTTDVLLARNNRTNFLTALRLIDLTEAQAAGSQEPLPGRNLPMSASALAEAAWFYAQLDAPNTSPSAEKADPARQAVDWLLET